jgi:hypothetical protein
MSLKVQIVLDLCVFVEVSAWLCNAGYVSLYGKNEYSCLCRIIAKYGSTQIQIKRLHGASVGMRHEQK